MAYTVGNIVPKGEPVQGIKKRLHLFHTLIVYGIEASRHVQGTN
jgi:hypothetical protein